MPARQLRGTRSIDMPHELGDRYNEADSVTHLGDSMHAANDIASALEAWTGALTVLDELGHPDAEAVRAKLRGTGS